jgi:hypothetical protein
VDNKVLWAVLEAMEIDDYNEMVRLARARVDAAVQHQDALEASSAGGRGVGPTRGPGLLSGAPVLQALLVDREVDNPQLQGPDDRLGPVGGSKLAYKVLDVVLDGAQADHEVFGDLAIGLPKRHTLQHL